MRSLILLAMILSSGVWAADEVRTVIRCQTDRVTDGGYQVAIETGGFFGGLVARVGENSFFGHQPVGTVAVEKISQLDGVEYRDKQTHGAILSLTIDYNKKVGSNRLAGNLKADLNGTVIPPKELPEFGEMTCLPSAR